MSIINEVKSFAHIGKRIDEILAWINIHQIDSFIILDDDKSLRDLPENLKSHWVECQFLTGFNTQCLQRAMMLV